MSSSPASQKRSGSDRKVRKKKRGMPKRSFDSGDEYAEDLEEQQRQSLMDTLASLLNREVLADVHFLVGCKSVQRFPAHRYVTVLCVCVCVCLFLYVSVSLSLSPLS